VVGTGIQWRGQTTLAAHQAMQRADCVLYAVNDPWAAAWICELNPAAKSFDYPRNTRHRSEIYEAMVAAILGELERGRRVCAVFYGSPTLLTQPAHLAVQRAVERGYPARILPGVSSVECLFADLNIDPCRGGYQIVEATDFLARNRALDGHSHVVLCQIALVNHRAGFDADDERVRRGLEQLRDRLLRVYPEWHEVVIYEAAAHPLVAPRIERVPLANLARYALREISSLYVPPLTASGAHSSSSQQAHRSIDTNESRQEKRS
jgi:uncharacterized protein YabN with tetrapyrrole methylase and pyrophosphatase domain